MADFTQKEKLRFWVLVIIVAISGFSQGMLLPLIAVIFEQDGVSSSLNGLSATGLYIGILIISPFMEPQIRKFGYRPVILTGGGLVIASLFLFPLWKSVLFWFFLRMIIGIGDNMLHFSTQTWITSFSPQHRLGRNIAIYGLSFGVGFGAGPLFVPLVNVFEGLPFIISGLLCLAAWSLVFWLENDFPESASSEVTVLGIFRRSKEAVAAAWIAFLPPLGYGFLEASLNASYPVYALRQSLDVSFVSILLFAFSAGAIVTQIPLGSLSDRIGRRPVLLLALGGGAFFFMAAGFAEQSEWLLFILFIAAGMFVGSTFSLGISYMSDLTPKELLPTGNLLCGVAFSLGSLSGPFLGGLFIQYAEGVSFLLMIGLMLAAMFFLVLFGRANKPQAETKSAQ
ncbi:MFS transporter [Indiicoccus explosivorum]|uniref:MFS transporter n=1 Tax=Indiicoccus explosivorum TaxID=1917864 RepID=UPI000B454BB5|nr:MFS transporter [Indiicoccus explosivorum]